MRQMTFSNVYDAELAIRQLLKNDNNCEAFVHVYELSENPNRWSWQLMTLNPSHNTPFLLHSVETQAGGQRLDAYNALYDYVYQLKQSMTHKDHSLLHYTVEWVHGDGTTKTSYFCGKSVGEILRKFNFGKAPAPTILTITLNPVS